MRLVIITTVLCAIAPAAHAVELGPLAPAAEGKVQCVSPNPVAKTCQAISTIRVAASGEVQDETVEMLAYGPVIVMKIGGSVQIKGDAECKVLRMKDYVAATFTIDGRPADAAQTARFRTTFQVLEKPLIGHVVCSVYRPQGDAMLATATVDGTALPQFDRRLIWVSPADGWKVGS